MIIIILIIILFLILIKKNKIECLINTNKIKLLRHYIFINPYDLEEDMNKNETFIYIKKFYEKKYVNEEIVKYYSYNDLKELAKNFDSKLYNLFIKINPIYTALLADIGRILILYNYGGVYHDLKFISTKKLSNYLNYTKSKFFVHIFNNNNNKIRNSNIIVLERNNIYLKKILQLMTQKLTKLYEKNILDGSNYVFLVGTGSFVEIVKKYDKNITKLKLDKEFIERNHKIYHKNIVRWQDTHEKLFL